MLEFLPGHSLLTDFRAVILDQTLRLRQSATFIKFNGHRRMRNFFEFLNILQSCKLQFSQRKAYILSSLFETRMSLSLSLKFIIKVVESFK